MQQRSTVAITIAALALGAALAPPAGAGERVALLGCDLTASDGPTATFLQIGGEAKQVGSRHPSIASGSAGFATGSTSFATVRNNGGSSSPDVRGESCARVMADLVDDGFEFRSSQVSERFTSQLVSIWEADN